jgi:ferredoxin-type protein NapF
MNMVFRTSGLRTFSAVLALILVLPLPVKTVNGFYLWLSPFIMLNSVLSSRTLVILNLAAFLVLVVTIFKKRWFCHNLCPVGWSCDLISGLNKKKEYTYKRIPDIGKWMAVISLAAAITGIPVLIFLDPLAIFHGFFTVFTGKANLVSILALSGFIILLSVHLFLPGIWCSKICPLGGLQLFLNETGSYIRAKTSQKSREIPDYNPGRRFFVMTGIGLLAGFSVHKILKPRPVYWLRPPSSVNAGLFNSLCCRCGNCIRACPTKILAFRTSSEDFQSFMTPEVNFRTGYCLEDCNLCSRVCPTGAISSFRSDEKDNLFMGKAEIELQNCLLLNNRECHKCNESCKYDAVEFRPLTGLLDMLPVIDNDKCVGCGACMVVCPESCITIIPPGGSPVSGI